MKESKCGSKKPKGRKKFLFFPFFYSKRLPLPSFNFFLSSLLHRFFFFFELSKRSVFVSLCSFVSFAVLQALRQLAHRALKRGDEITQRAFF